MPRDRKRKDPLDEPDDLLAPEDTPPEKDPADAEPEPSPFDDEPDEHETVPLRSDDLLDEEAEPPPSDLSDDEGLLDDGRPPEEVDDDEPVADEVSLSRDLDPDTEIEDVEEATEEEGPATAWDEELEDSVGGVSESEWAELEHEGQLLAPGRVVVGYKEFVSFPDEGVADLQARCDTGEPRSIFYGTSEPLGGGRFRLTVGDCVMEAKGGEEDGELFVRARLVLGGTSRRVAFRVIDRIAESPVVLGRDALEGYFVVDVALGYIHKSAYST
jgi:hypothetical protein